MRRNPTRWAAAPLSRRRILTLCSPEFSGSGAINIQSNTGPSSALWFSANDPVAYPFRLSEAVIVDQLGICNGSAAGGGFDVGVYSSSFVRLVSTGTQTGSGNNQWQFINVTDTPLLADTLYYLAAVRDNTTANRQRILNFGGSVLAGALAGVKDSTTDAYPLPDPLTNMVTNAVTTSAQLCGLACRAPF